ncbi:MAG TPA: ABC transporter permease [Anaerolineaceae bacterium]|nr:ABC transporter permease [Anaerolineaceae bacterium]
MRAFTKLTWVQAKMFLREPMGAFFTLLFGPLMMLLLGVIFGNHPDAQFGGRGYLDYSIAGYAAMVAGLAGLTTIPISASTRRESGVLRRFSVTPLRPLVYFLSDVLVPLVMTMLGILLLFLVGMLGFGVRYPGTPAGLASLAGATGLGALAFFALGYALAGLIRSARAVMVIGNVIVYPLVIFSGAFMPPNVMPEGLQRVSQFLPLGYLVTLLRGLWFGETWSAHLTETAVLAAMLAVCTLIVTRTFRWS